MLYLDVQGLAQHLNREGDPFVGLSIDMDKGGTCCISVTRGLTHGDLEPYNSYEHMSIISQEERCQGRRNGDGSRSYLR